MNVAVLGASPKPDRYSYRAVELLQQHGHRPIPVHPVHQQIQGIPVVKDLTSLGKADTLSVYINRDMQQKMAAEILAFDAQRVIFNPGTENPDLAEQLRNKGTEVVENCTLVMLRSGLF